MMKHIKYAVSRYPYWLTGFATVVGIAALLQFDFWVSLVIVVICFSFPFIIPFIASYARKSFILKTLGKTKVELLFGDLFEEKCIVITTNNHYDIIPTGEFISAESVIGSFVNNYCSQNATDLENDLKSNLQRDNLNQIIPAEYGHFVKKTIAGKIVYFLVFIDRTKTNQPDDFYIKTLLTFFKSLVNENHGKTIAMPLIGNNNNLSNSGFSNSEVSLLNLMTMINCFEITNQHSELKLKIVAKPEERANLIRAISLFK